MWSNELSEINKQYPEKYIPFLQEMNQQWTRDRPLQGVRVLHNLLNSYETLHKLEPLLNAGAEVTVTRADWVSIPHQAEVEAIIRKCGMTYIPDYKDLEGEFDIGMDCAARILTMKNVRIKHGVVELTQAGASLYKETKTPYPVISVDDSYLKCLECMYGTGEAFIRAFESLTGSGIPDRKFVVFGYGKIGQGIVKYLSKYTQKIVVFEKSTEAINLAIARGIEAHSVDIPRSQLLTLLSNAYAVVTATGVPGLLSKYLSAEDVGDAYLANMGVDDEIGRNFNENHSVLYGKYPINFSLKHPTLMKYLDPIFYAHNLAADLIMSKKPSAGFYPFDSILDTKIIEKWVRLHCENVDDIWDCPPFTPTDFRNELLTSTVNHSTRSIIRI